MDITPYQKYKPVGNRILVVPDKEGDGLKKTKAGIYLPPTNEDKKYANRKVTWGTVVATGSAVEGRINPLDRVMFFAQDATEVTIDEDEDLKVLLFHEPHLVLHVGNGMKVNK